MYIYLCMARRRGPASKLGFSQPWLGVQCHSELLLVTVHCSVKNSFKLNGQFDLFSALKSLWTGLRFIVYPTVWKSSTKCVQNIGVTVCQKCSNEMFIVGDEFVPCSNATIGLDRQNRVETKPIGIAHISGETTDRWLLSCRQRCRRPSSISLRSEQAQIWPNKVNFKHCVNYQRYCRRFVFIRRWKI